MTRERDTFTALEEVPVVMNAADLAKFLGISKANAYTLMHSVGFPTLRIGSRMLVERRKFFDWLDKQPHDDCTYCV